MIEEEENDDYAEQLVALGDAGDVIDALVEKPKFRGRTDYTFVPAPRYTWEWPYEGPWDGGQKTDH